MRIIILNKYIRVLPEKKSVTRGGGRGMEVTLFQKENTKTPPIQFYIFQYKF
jgi:hypothetical protein